MNKKKLLIALAGNANVGKSVIFNYLTGLHQHIGNWPGKTVEHAEGTLRFRGYTIDIVDLPGIYSLSTYSLEELVSRKYIAVERPDIVINVIDASVLERNLFFTLQLMELETPMVIALNQIDMAKGKGIKIDTANLENLLGVPVMPTVAVKGVGIDKLLEKAIETVEKRPRKKPPQVMYGKEVEKRVEVLVKTMKGVQLVYPARYVAIKLLEGDKEITQEIKKTALDVVSVAKKLAGEIEQLHGHGCSTVITSDRYEAAGCIARASQKLVPPIKPTAGEKLHDLTTHKVTGYAILIASLLAIFYSIFSFGDFTSGLLSDWLYGLEPFFTNAFGTGIAT
jgi:ferrous iron transport protein B